jgi:Spy/CpxP family protein refolding chaperone
LTLVYLALPVAEDGPGPPPRLTGGGNDSIMNRWIRRTVTLASFASALALVPAGLAFAQQAQSPDQAQAGQHEHHRGHREGLIGAALKLDSLTPQQRSQIEALAQQRKTASMPVRQADAQVLTMLAKQVERASIDPQGLASSLNNEQSATTQQGVVERDTLNQLHAILTPAQRNQLVDSIEATRTQAMQDHKDGGRGDGEAHRGGGERAKLGLTADQKAQIRANMKAEWQASRANGATPERAAHKQALESFRGDSFDASSLVRVENRGERAEKLAQAMVPVLTPAQRATLASQLRARAAHESGS